MSADNTSKDLVFEQPHTIEQRTYGDRDTYKAYRNWTVAEVEELCWRVRASGGTDSTPIAFQSHTHEIRALHVEAFPVEIPRRIREPEPEPVHEPRPSLRPKSIGLAAACLLGGLLVAPLIAWIVGLVWGLVL